MRKLLLAGLLLLALGFMCIPTGDAQAQPPVVYAALFFSPSCGHCHYVITEIIPPLQDTYGEQLQVLYIDVSQPDGSALYDAACDALDVSDERCGYVPMLAIGTTVLIGGGEIPEQLPVLVAQGVAAEGIALPPIPGLDEAYEAAIEGEHSDASGESPQSPVSITYQKTTWQDRLRQDPVGNGLAVGVLSLLVIGLVVQIGHSTQLVSAQAQTLSQTNHAGWLFILMLALLTTAIAGTLMLENGSLSLSTTLAFGVTTGMVLVVWKIGQVGRSAGYTGDFGFPSWLLPFVALLGLVVAGYLAYIEIGENQAVCGAVGDCNTVQQSVYAEVFGLLPIGLLGMFGYLAILFAWLMSRSANAWLVDVGHAMLLGLALFGTAFSIYLTFLEPFVIGATCAWCLTSAMVMILLLCLHAPTGWTAVNRLVDSITGHNPLTVEHYD